MLELEETEKEEAIRLNLYPIDEEMYQYYKQNPHPSRLTWKNRIRRVWRNFFT